MYHLSRFRLIALTATLLIVAASASFAGIIHVSATGDDANDGSTWALAKATVQAGLNAAVSGDEVWVGAGTYVENIPLKLGVGLYGGFAGTETARGQRDWTVNITILDGDQAGSVVAAPAGATSTTVIDGFTIQNGWDYYGGGIRCIESSSPTIANNTITGNGGSFFGGGIYCWYSSPAIISNTIMGNVADEGGGIFCHYGSALILNNTIALNNIEYGGGILCYGSSPTITNNTITGNSGSNLGGGICCDSGSPTITNNTITGNSGGHLGGAGIYSNSASPTIINNTVTGNMGGIYCFGSSSSPTLVSNIVAFNSSGVYYSSDGTAALRNNCVYGNAEYNYSGLPDPTGVDGNISVDPKLASVEYGNAHIQPDSPCIDAGDDSVVDPGWLDMDGRPRIQGAHVDIGADESDGTTWPQGPYIIVRVSPDGDDANDGSSWALAKRTVQAGIEAASMQGGEVWVEAGVYYEHVTLGAYAYLYGGFAGTETARVERNWNANVTILDGQQAQTMVVLVTAGHMCSTIDGFTVRNGYDGAGIDCYCCSSTIANNTVTGNSWPGILCSYSSPTITNNTVTGNTGDGISSWFSSPTITNNTVTANSGDGIYCSHSPFSTITNNTIAGNSYCGIGCSYVSGTIANNTITANVDDGIACYSSSPTIVNNTLTGNGDGIYCFGSSSSPTLVSNIVAFNLSGVCYSSDGTPTLRNNCVYGNTEYDYSGVPDPTGTDGNISVDPAFVDLPGGDYHITGASPCINAGWNDAPGLPSTDMDGEQRVLGIAVDIGADEYPWTATTVLEARLSADNTSVDLAGSTMSRGFPGFFYIETDDRSSGIRVEKMCHGVSQGMRVDVAGSLATNADGERYIEADTVTLAGTGSIDPLGMVNKSLGGGDWFYNPATGAGQKGVAGGTGLNNIGLLITTWGKVTYADTDYFYLDDGSALDDGSGHVGVKVSASGLTMPLVGDQVRVTGIGSCFKVGDDLHRLIRVRDQADIVVME